MSDSVAEKVARLEDWLRAQATVVIGYSGGVDSAFLAAVAGRVLGARARAVVADSPSLPRRHLERARAIAAQFGFSIEVIETQEMEDPAYAANGPDRCYHCKSELFSRLSALARAHANGAVVLDGTNADDAHDVRPGRRAAAEQGVRSPLLELGFTKNDIREASRGLGLPTADAPASACLASRLPQGTPVTPERLARVEQAEAALEALGFRQLRVRDHGEVARIELGPDEIPRLLDGELRREAAVRVRNSGFRFVALDLLGYRTGNLHRRDAPAAPAS
jgi:pyridinium-3,5-biscarboxylic acid mononucleotide sulfurtransferase